MNLKTELHKYDLINLIINYKRIVAQKINIKLYDDKTAICKIYKKRLGREINLNNPKRYTEKLQWEKLYYRNPLMTVCADKIAVRDYLINKGYEHYLMPVVGTYRSVEEIDVDNLPDKCIFKASHGSSMHLVKKNNNVNWFLWKKIMSSWMKMNIYIEGREWPYKNIMPGIICEKFIEPKTDQSLRDFKFFCFDGKAEYVQVDTDLLENHHIDFYDISWRLLPLRCQYPNSNDLIPKPVQFDEMKRIAEDLSKDFPHVRVDFCAFDDKFLIGELTFFDGSGFYSFNPDEYDFMFGKKLHLVTWGGRNSIGVDVNGFIKTCLNE